jgi:hypothetical protein
MFFERSRQHGGGTGIVTHQPRPVHFSGKDLTTA